MRTLRYRQFVFSYATPVVCNLDLLDNVFPQYALRKQVLEEGRQLQITYDDEERPVIMSSNAPKPEYAVSRLSECWSA